MAEQAEVSVAMQPEWMALSSLDGRDARMVGELRPHMSEYGYTHNRTRVEAAWLIELDRVLPNVGLSDQAIDYLATLASGDSFGPVDMAATKAHEAKTNHDVKAVELMLRDRLAESGLFDVAQREKVHFALTSEDVNNLADGLAWADVRDDVLFPTIDQIEDDLAQKADAWADIPMLSHTHGQPATPTTLGKEFAVFGRRIQSAAYRLGRVQILGKLNGATGNFNALRVAYPDVDWQSVTDRFIGSLGLSQNEWTTQIEPHDWMAEYLHRLGELGAPLMDLSQDAWQYISRGYLGQVKVDGEVGSSTMPHKVNPIDFEKAEANLGVSIALGDWLARKLPVSRMQRDLSDSSAKRTTALVFGHHMVALKSIQRGLTSIKPNQDVLAADLDAHWEVLTEPVQQILRAHGVEGGYDAMKAVSRGEVFGPAEYTAMLKTLDLPLEAMVSLRALTPSNYVGDAPELARQWAKSVLPERDHNES